MGVANEERPAVASEAMEQSTASGVDTAVAESEGRLLVAVKQDVVVETAPSADIPLAQADEVGPFETAASLVTEASPESEQVPTGESHDVASSSGTAPELPSLGFADTQC